MDDGPLSQVLHLGKTLLKGSAFTLTTVAASMFKQDKTVNKAINLLNEAIRQWVPRQQLDQGLMLKITNLLSNMPSEKGVHLQALCDTVQEYANPVDAAVSRAMLQNAAP